MDVAIDRCRQMIENRLIINLDHRDDVQIISDLLKIGRYLEYESRLRIIKRRLDLAPLSSKVVNSILGDIKHLFDLYRVAAGERVPEHLKVAVEAGL